MIKSKLFNLRKWLTVQDAAKYLSIFFEEGVGEADVLRLALDGHLKLSVNFVNHASAILGKFISIEDVEFLEYPSEDFLNRFPNATLPDELKDKSICIPLEIQYDNERFLKFDDTSIITIEGVWDLCMVGNEKNDVEHNYQMLTNGPEVTLTCLEGAFVEREGEQICQLQERFHEDDLHQAEQDLIAAGAQIKSRHVDDNKNRPYMHPSNFFPAGTLPKDSVLVVRTQAIIDLQKRTITPELKETPALDPRAERTYLNIIGALLEITTGTFQSENFSSETQLREFIAEKFDDLRGVSTRTLADKFALAKKALNGEMD